MLFSFRNNQKGILLMICSAVFVSFGQMYWKVFRMEDAHGILPSGFGALLLGLVLYAAGALIMIYAYRFGKLSVLQPMLALSYVLAIFIAVFLLGEHMTPLRVAGIAVIIAGVFLIGGGDAEPDAIESDISKGGEG